MRKFHGAYSTPDASLDIVDGKEKKQNKQKSSQKKPLRKHCEIHNGSSWGKKEEERLTGRREKTEIIIP